jgi:hypothetical protein
MAIRRAENARRMDSPDLPRDMARAHVSTAQLEQMRKHLCPLGFQDPRQYQAFRRALREHLHAAGLDDVDVGLTGTASTFYSENPSKPSGHFFDEEGPFTSDIDMNLSGPSVLRKIRDAGKKPHPTIPSIYRTRDVYDVYPEILEFSRKWSATLRRGVNLVVWTSPDPIRSPSEFVVLQAGK